MNTVKIGNAVIKSAVGDEPVLADVKLEAIVEVKKEAGKRISALDWKVTRAGEEGNDVEMAEVLLERAEIRLASDVAEADILSLETVEEVRNFSW